MTNPAGYLLELNERDNAIDYLRRAVREVDGISTDPFAWKWLSIAIHGAVYGFAVTAIQGSNGSTVTTKNGSLIPFMEAVDRVQDKTYFPYYEMTPVTISADDVERLRILNRVRNNLQHFSPKGHTTVMSGMPTIGLLACDIVDELVVRSIVAFDETARTELRALTDNLRTSLRPIEAEYRAFTPPPCSHSQVVRCSECGALFCMNCAEKLADAPASAEMFEGSCGAHSPDSA